MTLPEVLLGAACLALAVLWVRAELASQHLRDDLRAGTANARSASEALEQARQALQQAGDALAESDRERQAALAEAASLRRRVDGVEERRRRLALLTDEERAAQLAARCAWCGGVHERACPRLRSIRFRPDGSTPTAVEFWEHWDASEIIWPEDYVAAQADALADERGHVARELTVIVG